MQRAFAWLMRHAMGPYERRVARRKQVLFATLPSRGLIVEIGAGAGPNLRYLPPDARWIGLDPNPFMRAPVRAAAEHLPIANGSAAAVISTLVLCSVRDQAQALAEIHRVLRPGGRFYFLEHVASPPGTRGRLIQHCLKPVCACCADGCDPLRDTGAAIARAGFTRVEQDAFTLGFPHVVGVAIK